MSDNLISRKALVHGLIKDYEQCMTFDGLINYIANQPTIYNVDKVIEKLEDSKEKHEDECGFDEFEYIDYDEVINIVKAGGKND